MRALPPYIAAIFRQWMIIAIAVGLGVVGSLAYALVAPRVYSSTSTVLMAVESTGSASDRLQGSTYIVQTISTYSSAVTSSLVLQPVIDEFDLDTTLEDFREELSVSGGAESSTIEISANGDSPEEAQEITEAITAGFIELAPGLVTPTSPLPTDSITAGPASVNLTVVDEASLPLEPDSPRLLLAIPLGFVAGALAGLVIALARFWLDTRVRSEDRIVQIVGAPVIGRLPKRSGVDDGAWHDASRRLRLALLSTGQRDASIQFVSASGDEDTTEVVADVAEKLALADIDVLAIDADVRAPRLAEAFGIDAGRGFLDVVAGATDIDEIQIESRGVTVLAVGSSEIASDLLASDKLRRMLDEAAASHRLVLIDSSPLHDSSDALSIAKAAHAVVVVVAIGGPTEQMLVRATEQLRGAGAGIIGVVITRAPRRSLAESTSVPAVVLR